jgi:formylglycine-generating enzyme required for sulfatase activity/3',5'-cyclic AMP phosphodiesterase CpdA
MDGVLFAWIHLSDLHFGYGDAEHQWDQRLVLGAVRKDVAALVGGACPRPEAIFVTGDIAFSGGVKKIGEYEDAKARLVEIAEAVGLERESIFAVPGNHDVQRSVDAGDRDVGRLVKLIRLGEEKLDDALATDAALLRRRLGNYLTFAKDLAPACLAGGAAPEAELFWSHERATESGLRVRVAGLDTAMVAADDEDRGKLWLGKEQVARALEGAGAEANEPAVVLVLSHHPFTGGWLADEKVASSWVRGRAHIHLCGHVHEADARQVVTGGGSSLVTVTAGASYGDAPKGGPPARHGYNIAALVRGERGGLELAVWPRLWSPKNSDFRADVENVPGGKDCWRHAIAGVQAPAPRRKPGPAAGPGGGDASDSGAQGGDGQYDVFLAHASPDKERARELYGLLKPALRVFLDEESLLPGDDWSVEIPRAQARSRVTAVLVSRATDAAFYEREEIAAAIAMKRARQGGHRVVPVHLDGVPRDPFSAPYGLRVLQGIDATMAGGLSEVANRLKDAVAAQRSGAAPRESAGSGLPASAQRWLDAMADQHRWIRIVGFQERYKIGLPLDEIFVPLRVRAGRRKVESLKQDKLGENYVESRVVGTPEALEAASKNPNVAGLAVLGDPGAGKTTLLKQLFLRSVREGSAAAGLPDGLRPVLLRCSQLEPGHLTPGGLRAAVEREAERNGFAHCGEELVRSGAPILFLLDGLDEVRDEKARARLCNWLDREVSHWPKSFFVVTCRFAAWRSEAVLGQRFVPVDVLWLDESAVRSYVLKWFVAVERGLDPLGSKEKARARGEESAQKLLLQLLDPKRQANRRLREMTENPLLLSTLCLVHHCDWRLPEKRGKLYDRCISLMLDTWRREKEDAPNLPDESARQVLQPLAWAMHSAEAKEWPADKVVAAIESRLSELPDLPRSPEAFLERARDVCGVLASKDLGSYEFFHLSFQEYLAATHAREKGLIAELAEHAAEPWWREVILLAAAQPGVLGKLVRALASKSGLEPHGDLLRECVSEAFDLEAAPFVEAINRGLRGERGGVATARAVLQALGKRAPQDVLERARGLTAHEDVGIAAAARALVGEREVSAVAGAPVPGKPFREQTTKMSFLWVPPGKFWMGSSKTPGEPNYDKDAYDDEFPAREVTLTEGFWIGEHPVTNAQYAVFMEATGARAPEFWQDRWFNAPYQPLVGVDWEESLKFAQWMTDQAKLGAWRFHLPTEAEWEYAARGTDGRKYPWGEEAPTAERANYGGDGKPTPVGTHPAGRSPWLVQDMAGGVWERCLDGWQDNFANMRTNVVNPCHPSERGAPRVVRGGSWDFGPGGLRCAYRLRYAPQDRLRDLGFRVVCRGSRERIGL